MNVTVTVINLLTSINYIQRVLIELYDDSFSDNISEADRLAMSRILKGMIDKRQKELSKLFNLY